MNTNTCWKIFSITFIASCFFSNPVYAIDEVCYSNNGDDVVNACDNTLATGDAGLLVDTATGEDTLMDSAGVHVTDNGVTTTTTLNSNSLKSSTKLDLGGVTTLNATSKVTTITGVDATTESLQLDGTNSTTSLTGTTTTVKGATATTQSTDGSEKLVLEDATNTATLTGTTTKVQDADGTESLTLTGTTTDLTGTTTTVKGATATTQSTDGSEKLVLEDATNTATLTGTTTKVQDADGTESLTLTGTTTDLTGTTTTISGSTQATVTTGGGESLTLNNAGNAATLSTGSGNQALSINANTNTAVLYTGGGTESVSLNSASGTASVRASTRTTVTGGSTSVVFDQAGITLSNTADAEGLAQVRGVRDGVMATDAVNLRQLTRAFSGIAVVAAMAQVPEPIYSDRFSVGVGYGNFSGQEAVALGINARITRNLTVKASAGRSQGYNAYGAGAGFSW